LSIYYVSVGNNEYQVEIDDNNYKIDGEVVQASLIALKEHGVYIFRKGLWKREIHVEAQGKSQYALDTKGLHTVAKVEKNSPRRRRITATGVRDLIAPMPGQVVSVHVTVGDRVEKGQILVVEESMKMLMNMYASCAGIVTQINAQTGMLIAKGDILVKIEEI
jgi:biotin carboxyl carrier protein